MKLRPYQSEAVDAIYAAWQTHQSTLAVLPTGTGKTIMFAHVIKQLPFGRTLLLAHREELIWQGSNKIEAVTGTRPDIEMAEFQADRRMWGQSKVVVSSIQTQVAGNEGKGRMKLFDPEQFALVIVDEAHHCTAVSYRKVLEHYKQNPKIKILGVTATPDRADEKALGEIFESVAYNYELMEAIADGWLVPITNRLMVIQGLDYSKIRTTAGDLNGADLAQQMLYETPLHKITDGTLKMIGDRRTLVFAASVAHAERMSEIFNRPENKPGSSRWVCGETPKDQRRQMIADYAAGKFQILCNVGVATEGFQALRSHLIEKGVEDLGMRFLRGVGLAVRKGRSVILIASTAGRGQEIVDPLRHRVDIVVL